MSICIYIHHHYKTLKIKPFETLNSIRIYLVTFIADKNQYFPFQHNVSMSTWTAEIIDSTSSSVVVIAKLIFNVLQCNEGCFISHNFLHILFSVLRGTKMHLQLCCSTDPSLFCCKNGNCIFKLHWASFKWSFGFDRYWGSLQQNLF